MKTVPLIHLRFNFSEESESVQADELCQKLLNHVNQSSLYLDFSAMQYAPSKIFSEASRLLINFSLLETLELNFQSCRRLDDETLHSLSRSFEQMNLKSLKINLKWCMEITEHGTQPLVQSLKHLSNLSALAL